MAASPQLSVFPVGNFTFGSKPAKFEKDSNVSARMERLKEKYAREGLRRSVDAVLVVHEHGHPHVLVLQMGASFFKLPGGRLRPGEDEAEGLMRKLTSLLAPPAETMRPDWRIADVLGTWYRPNFEAMMYPYCPAHIARPKEVKRLFLVALPERCYLAVPKNMRLVAVPLFEIYDNVGRYGPVISSIPTSLSRWNLSLAGRAPAALPAAAAVATAAAQQQAAAAAAAAQQQQQQLVQYGQAAAGAAAPAKGGITVSLSAPLPAAAPPPQQQAPAAAYQQPAAQHHGEDNLFVDFDDM